MTADETWTFFDGDWHAGDAPVFGARTHAFWLGSSVFDGARAFEGVTPDLDRHCERVNASALAYLATSFVAPRRMSGSRGAFIDRPLPIPRRSASAKSDSALARSPLAW